MVPGALLILRDCYGSDGPPLGRKACCRILNQPAAAALNGSKMRSPQGESPATRVFLYFVDNYFSFYSYVKPFLR